MRTYEVYSNGQYCGNVLAKNEKEAIQNGQNKYNIKRKKDITVKLK